ncbi:chitin deacetylase [Bacillus sp. HMF5848]|uniref:polysaccharide deacetylase family protein n=1 Tax=Bacillus sp. HMF5848 TaxID=2495421 RepID=UPI000F76D6E4|nr:polysaccharide deacetylase family protein [Bacillus sp. HMF5848]RSK28637.1 chitin deacetylase [Bacillus sp. HMF5848]
MKKLLTIMMITISLIGCTAQAQVEPQMRSIVLSQKQLINQGIPVLMYHTFDEDPTFPTINVTPEHFQEQLAYLKKQGYDTITSEELVKFLNGETVELPEKPFVITIDDGYKSVYDEAYPIIQELGYEATLFVITKHVETGERLGLPFSDWSELRRMQASGVIEVENHTNDLHYRVNNEAGQEAMITLEDELLEEHLSRVEEDLEYAIDMIEEQVGSDVFAFSYPYGAYNEDIEKLVAEDHTLVYTVEEGLNYFGDNPLRVKRINVNDEMTGEELVTIIESLETKKEANRE